jgi:very-short-patch-repair endonuclease
LAFADPKAESPCELLARVVLHRGGLPAPQTQVLIGDEWFWYARVDFAWPAYGTVLEADGLLTYRDPARPDALQREKLRQERLEELGLQVVRVTWHQLVEEPERCCDRVRAAFCRAASRPQTGMRCSTD